MITFFSIPKLFHGHSAVIQKNAIQSWKLLHPHNEIILFGNDDGVANCAADLHLRHIPEVSQNEFGTPLLDDVFDQAQQIASHSILCYAKRRHYSDELFHTRSRLGSPAV